MALALVEPLTPDRPAAYGRISADAEARGLGVERQRRDCGELLERKGWPAIVEWYEDNDISASRKRGKVAHRPAYERLLADIAAHRVDAVVAWELDRLCRDPLEQEQFFLACERAGVHYVATYSDDVDIATGEGLMIARIKGAVNAEEARRVAKRVRRKKLEIAEAGREHGGGPRRFGYRYDPATKTTEVVEDEAAMIRDAAARILAGESLQSIANGWTRAGMMTVQVRPWRATTLRDVLRSPRIAGLRQHQGAVIGEANWPAILDRSTWEQVGVALSGRARGDGRGGRPASHLLSGGLLRCSECDGPLSMATISGKRRYRCAPRGEGLPGCGAVTIIADPLEEFVTEAALHRLDSRKIKDARARARKGATAKDDAVVSLERAEARQRELAEMWAAGEINRAEWVVARQRVEQDIADARRRLVPEPTSPLEGIKSIRQEWPELPVDRQRAILTWLLDRIVVSPAQRGRRTFDPDRLTPEWRV